MLGGITPPTFAIGGNMKNVLILLLCTITGLSFAEPIRVGYIKGSTLADIKSGMVYGDDVDLIRSSISGNTVDFVQYNTVKDLLNATKTGDIDLGIGGISMTPERVVDFDFSIPTAVNNITVCYDTGNTSNTAKLTGKVFDVIKKSLLQLFIILTVFAHLIWVVERYNKDDSNFAKAYWRGICDSYWWGLVTSSTVGYGDLVPKTVIGRILGGLIIITGVTWFGLYIGSIGSAYSEITNGGNMIVGVDLHHPITKTGSTSCDILNELNIDYITFDTLDECFNAMSDGVGDCIVFDENKLSMYVTRDEKLEITEQVFKKEYVGVVFGENFKQRDMINKTIVLGFLTK
jgi:ABC-type amino acid transport substrate-binding protein